MVRRNHFFSYVQYLRINKSGQDSCLFVLLETTEEAQDSSKLVIFRYMYTLRG